MGLVVLHPKHEHYAKSCTKTENTGEHSGRREVETNLYRKREKMARKSFFLSYLCLVQLTQHHHCECEHYHITAKHFPDVKEDGLEADVVEASGSEDDDGDVVFASFSRTQVYQVLLKVEAVLIRHLKAKN